MARLPEVCDVLTIAGEMRVYLIQRDVGRIHTDKLYAAQEKLGPAIDRAALAAPSIAQKLLKLRRELQTAALFHSNQADVDSAFESAEVASYQAIENTRPQLDAAAESDKWPLATVSQLIEATQYAYHYRGCITRSDALGDVGIEAERLLGRINKVEGVETLRALAAAESRPFNDEWLRCLHGRVVAGGNQPSNVDAMSVSAFLAAIQGGGERERTDLTVDEMNTLVGEYLKRHAKNGNVTVRDVAKELKCSFSWISANSSHWIAYAAKKRDKPKAGRKARSGAKMVSVADSDGNVSRSRQDRSARDRSKSLDAEIDAKDELQRLIAEQKADAKSDDCAMTGL